MKRLIAICITLVIFYSSVEAQSTGWTRKNGVIYPTSSKDTVRVGILDVDSLDANIVTQINVNKYGAKGDGVTNDRTAIQAALNAVPTTGGAVYFPAGTFKISDTLSVRSRITIIGAGKFSTIIKQATLNKNAINIRGDSVTIQDISIVGTNDTTAKQLDGNTTPSSTQYVGVYCAGDSTTKRKNIEFKDCLIRNFDYGVCAYYNYGFIFNSGIIDSVLTGIIGGTGNINCQNDTSMSWSVINSGINCTYGWSEWSRPITLPLHSGGALIQSNVLRGGGISFENLASSATYSNKRRLIIISNDCDAAISGGDIISGNIMDTRQMPLGRSRHLSFYQAIEPAFNAIVSNNIVKHFVNGVATVLQDVIITNNQFIECGSDSTTGNGGVITAAAIPTLKSSNVLIKNNVFLNSQGLVPDIYLNPNATDTISTITIDGNSSINGNSYFLIAYNVKGLVVKSNFIKNCAYTLTVSSADAAAIREFGLVEALYSNNEILNELTDGHGMYYAYVCAASSIQGFSKITNPRSGTAYYSQPSNTVCPIYMLNGVITYYSQFKMGENLYSNGTSIIGGAAAAFSVSNRFVQMYDSVSAEYGLGNSKGKWGIRVLYPSGMVQIFNYKTNAGILSIDTLGQVSATNLSLSSDRLDQLFFVKGSDYGNTSYFGYKQLNFTGNTGRATINATGIPLDVSTNNGDINTGIGSTTTNIVYLPNTNNIQGISGGVSFDKGITVNSGTIITGISVSADTLLLHVGTTLYKAVKQ